MKMITNINIFLFLLVSLALANKTSADLKLQPLSSYSSGIFNESAAESVAYDPATYRLYVANVGRNRVDVLDISDPANPATLLNIDTTSIGDEPTSVAVMDGIVAVSVRNQPQVGENPGNVSLYNTDGSLLNVVQVGFGPDKVVFTPDGTKILVANEGTPSDDYQNDPEGSVSIIDLSGGVAAATVTTASFIKFNGQEKQLRSQGIRIFGPLVLNGTIVGQASAAKDLEPENISVSPDSTTAWITLQENNAVAILDIANSNIIDIKGFGFKNHQSAGNGLDASDQDGGINISKWKVKGMFQPDGIECFTISGQQYLITANEGNARDFSGFSEKVRLKDIKVNPGLLKLQDDDKLGQLLITTEPPHGKKITKEGEIILNSIYSFGTRSFSIWKANNIERVFDSGDDIEQITATNFPTNFNANHVNQFSGGGEPDNLDNRSNEKGPEPESLVVGEIDGKTYVFVGLERIGGVIVYDVTNPIAPSFQSYINLRDFNQPNTIILSGIEITNPDVGDLGIEDMTFITASESPNGIPLLVTVNKVSGTTTIFEVSDTSP